MFSRVIDLVHLVHLVHLQARCHVGADLVLDSTGSWTYVGMYM